MPENMDGLFNSIDATNAQLKALMKVIDEITGKPIVAKPADIYLPKVTEIVTSTTIRNLEMQAQEKLSSRGWLPDYIAIRKQSDLQKPTGEDLERQEPLVVLAAAKLGNTRLIDNLEI